MEKSSNQEGSMGGGGGIQSFQICRGKGYGEGNGIQGGRRIKKKMLTLQMVSQIA